jgi:hypothetical protein
MLLHTRFLVGSIIDTRESSFRKRQLLTQVLWRLPALRS